MSTNTINGVMFIIAGLTPFVVYLGLGPDGAVILSAARTEQLFAYLFFSLPIAFMMTRRIQNNYFVDSGLLILVASMSIGMVADAFRADTDLTNMSDAVAITAYSSTMLGVSLCGIGVFQTDIFPKWLSGLFAVVTSIGFIILATLEPSQLDTSAMMIAVFLTFHLLLVVLGIFIMRRSE